jgi:hypothetical protein
MKFIPPIFIILIGLSCGKKVTKKSSQDMKNPYSVKVMSVLPGLDDSGNLIYDTVASEIYYYKNLAVYIKKDRLLKAEQEYNNREYSFALSESGVKLKYIIRENNEPWGYLFESINANDHGSRINIDSFLSKSVVTGLDRYYSKRELLNVDSLVYPITKVRENVYVEKYYTKNVNDETQNDSVFYYYTTGLNDCNFSFIPKLDSASRMKLFKVTYFFRKRILNSNNVLLPEREWTFLVEKKAILDEKVFVDFCENFLKLRH